MKIRTTDHWLGARWKKMTWVLLKLIKLQGAKTVFWLHNFSEYYALESGTKENFSILLLSPIPSPGIAQLLFPSPPPALWYWGVSPGVELTLHSQSGVPVKWSKKERMRNHNRPVQDNKTNTVWEQTVLTKACLLAQRPGLVGSPKAEQVKWTSHRHCQTSTHRWKGLVMHTAPHLSHHHFQHPVMLGQPGYMALCWVSQPECEVWHKFRSKDLASNKVFHAYYTTSVIRTFSF